METVLITGAAGFIGFHTCRRLIQIGYRVEGLDNFNPYYDVRLKRARAQELAKQGLVVREMDLKDSGAILDLFQEVRPTYVVHLGAQAGVRYSLEAPALYLESNITGTLNILEACRKVPVEHLVFASSSSVYGLNTHIPFSVGDRTDHPISLYAATKKSNELMAHSYAHLFNIPTTGLRFFTVYGPWGRPDMAYFLFTRAITEGRPIQVFDAERMKRDFTYVDDVVEGVVRVMKQPAAPDPAFNPESPDPASSSAPFRVYNIGNNNPIRLGDFIRSIEKALGKKAIRKDLPAQPGDMTMTYADIDALVKDFEFKPSTPIEEGMKRFADWYKAYYAHRDPS